MKLLLLVVMSLCTLTSIAGGIYKWTDADGHVHYGENPGQGKAVDLPPLSTYKPTIRSEPKPVDTDSANEASADEGPSVNYSRVRIKTPGNDAAIYSNRGLVDVVAETTPGLAENDRIQGLVDGQPVGGLQDNVAFRLSGLNPGTHTLRLEIRDNKGVVKSRSRTVTFHLLRHTLASPARPKAAGN